MIGRVAPLLILVCLPRLVTSQALPVHSETALTTAFEERGLRVFGMVGRRENLTVGVTSLVILPFAPHQRVTTMVQLPLVYKRMTAASDSKQILYSNVGLGDVTVAAKWAVFARDRFGGTTRFAVVGTARLPTGTTDATLETGDLAPRPLQLGTGAFATGAVLVGTAVRGRWGVSADVGHSRSAKSGGYRFGSVTRYDVAIGVRFPNHIETLRSRTLQLYLEWNGSVAERDRDGALAVQNTGGHVGFLSPGVQWVVLPQLLFEGSVQIPVIQDFNGTQPDFAIRAAVGTRFQFF